MLFWYEPISEERKGLLLIYALTIERVQLKLISSNFVKSEQSRQNALKDVTASG